MSLDLDYVISSEKISLWPFLAKLLCSLGLIKFTPNSLLDKFKGLPCLLGRLSSKLRSMNEEREGLGLYKGGDMASRLLRTDDHSKWASHQVGSPT